MHFDGLGVPNTGLTRNCCDAHPAVFSNSSFLLQELKITKPSLILFFCTWRLQALAPLFCRCSHVNLHARNLLQTHLKATRIWPFLLFRVLGWAEQTRGFLPATYTFQYFFGHKTHIIPSNMFCACICSTVSQQDFRMRVFKITSCKFLLLLPFYPWYPRNNRRGSRHFTYCILCILCRVFGFWGFRNWRSKWYLNQGGTKVSNFSSSVT